MENGKWKMESGKWKVESGNGKVENGKGRGVLGFLASLREGGGPLAVEGARERLFFS